MFFKFPIPSKLMIASAYAVGAFFCANAILAAPVAVPSAPANVNEGQNFILDGTTSFDDQSPAFNIDSWDWVQISGPLAVPASGSGSTLEIIAPEVSTDTVIEFELTVTNNKGNPGDSDTESISITVLQVNQEPTANAGIDLIVDENTNVDLDGTGTPPDPDGDTLSFSWTQDSGPGVTLNNADTASPSFTAPSIASGTAELVFRLTVDDGNGGSSQDTVTVTVQNVNQAPSANNQTLTIDEDQSTEVTLSGSDPDVSPLTFSIVTFPPENEGTVTGTPPTVTFSPALNFNGQTTFTFKANDGEFDSLIATVTINIDPVNDPPVVNNLFFVTSEETPVGIVLIGDDVDGDLLTFARINSPLPSHGSLSGVPPNFLFTPAEGFNGVASFTFRANDGQVDSTGTATVSITVTPVNDAPYANDINLSTNEDSPVNIVLSGGDPDGNVPNLIVVSTPSAELGLLSGISPNLLFTPAPNYYGPVSFSYKANDGIADSTKTATVSITVNSVNDAPVANAGPDQVVIEGGKVVLEGSAFDVDVPADTLAYQWTLTNNPIDPIAPTLNNNSIANPELTAPADVSMQVEFVYTLFVTDGHGGTSSDTVRVTVTNGFPPEANAGENDFALELTSVTLMGSAVDIDSQEPYLYFWEQLSGPAVVLSNYNEQNPSFLAPGVDEDTILTFRLTVTDAGGNTGIDEVTWVIQHVAPAPSNAPLIKDLIAFPSPFSARQGVSIRYELNSSASAQILIVDMFGRMVREIHVPSGTTGGSAGVNTITWDGKNGEGEFVGNGVYLIQVKADDGLGSTVKLRERVGVAN